MLTHHQASHGISSLNSLSLKYMVYLPFQKIFLQKQIFTQVALGETALAFYTATNRTSKPIDGVSTYNVVPFEAGQYFNKIQCFCFEEQRLNPNEQVSLFLFSQF
jgi:cytochrome c oxidase assembly protein subunit 11